MRDSDFGSGEKLIVTGREFDESSLQFRMGGEEGMVGDFGIERVRVR